ncbi:MAG: adenylosuccinate lyase [Bdellovibrionales bacterium]|nr:adenylosuccinate lyase [Bdellovibrionales bacterium]
MIKRYTRKEMGDLWTAEARFENMLQVEKMVAQVQGEMGLIPKEAAKAIVERGSFNVDRILEIEQTTRHDVIAFVSNVAETIGPEGRYVHFGLTSSDVLDTALSLQIVKAFEVLEKSLGRLLQSLKKKMMATQDYMCAGRTHGMHAEPTTMGYKLAGFAAEFVRHRDRLQQARKQIGVGKMSGAVGTYSFLSREFESAACRALNLIPETLATQVIPRDRHAEVMTALALLGGGIERLAIEIRHMQRTEMGEAYEGFAAGQKGSSAMPHKKNPIGAENLTGAARLLRSYAMAALENIALWHERDISHSSVERVAFPDAFILADYACDRMANIIDQLEINQEQLLKNMDISQGQLFSSHVLLHLVDQGLSREDAYVIVQRLSHGLMPGQHLKNAILEDGEAKKHFTTSDVASIFSGERHLKNTKAIIQKIGETI